MKKDDLGKYTILKCIPVDEENKQIMVTKIQRALQSLHKNRKLEQNPPKKHNSNPNNNKHKHNLSKHSK